MPERNLRLVHIAVVESEGTLYEGGVRGARPDRQTHGDVIGAALDDRSFAELRRGAGQAVGNQTGRRANLIIENTAVGAAVRQER